MRQIIIIPNLGDVWIKSYSVEGLGAADADSFDFKSATEADAADCEHDDWIPILDIDKGTHRSANQSNVITENVTLNFLKVYETVSTDIWSDFGWMTWRHHRTGSCCIALI